MNTLTEEIFSTRGITALGLAALTTLVLTAGCAPAADDGEPADRADQPDGNAMTFFITSAGPGNGADLGGLDGADATARASPRAWARGTEPGVPT